MKIVLKPLAKSILIPLRLTTVASGTNAVIQKKIWYDYTDNLKLRNE